MIARTGDLLDRVPHVSRREELALLDVDDASRAGCRDDQIGLPREERGNLQDVGDFGRARGLPGFVDVGQDRHASRFANAREDAQPFVDPRTAKGPRRRAVGLVVRRLEDVLHAGAAGDIAHGESEVDSVRLALDHARACNQEQRRAAPDRQAGELNRRHAA